MAEVLGRRGLGQGALDFPPDDWRHVIIPDVSKLDSEQLEVLKLEWASLAKMPPIRFSEVSNDKTHQQVDITIMRILGFSEEILDKIYNEVSFLIESRLAKAASA